MKLESVQRRSATQIPVTLLTKRYDPSVILFTRVPFSIHVSFCTFLFYFSVGVRPLVETLKEAPQFGSKAREFE